MNQDSHSELRRLFDLVIETPPDRRAAVLDSQCGGDANLRARLAAMVAAAEQADFLSEPTGALEAPQSGAARTAELGSAQGSATGDGATIFDGPGQWIGPYKLLEKIGEGGFGTVFMAEQEQPVRRKVALKIIRLGMDTRQVVARFEHERQALALMDHPHIAKVFDAGATQTGRPYFVMELVKGEPIVQYCDRNNLSIPARLELFAQVCSAVQHAHTKGIIHRDIKPSNILVATQDGHPYPKVIDFGIAKATDSKLTEKTLFTEHKALIGTPEYMSPEQAEGSLDIDTRTDVYSLGVLLYELLTGTTPFSSSELRSAAYAEIQRIIREVEPAKPSTRLSQNAGTLANVAARRQTEPKRLGTTVRGELDWIVMKALEKERGRRYETANGLAADIARYLSGEPILAAPPSKAYRLHKFLRRHRVVVTAGALIASALLLGVVGTTWGWVWALRERERAEQSASAERLAQTEARERAEALEKVAGFQASQLGEIDAPLMGSRLRDALVRSVRSAAEREQLAPEAVETRVKELERMLAGADFTGLATESLDVNIFRRALGAIDRQFGDQPLVKARLLQTVVDSLMSVGLLEQARQPQEEALKLRRTLLGPDHPLTLESLRASATLQGLMGRYDEAKALFAETLERRRRVLGNDHPDTLTSVFEMGSLLYQQGQYSAAEPLYQQALDGRKRVLPEGHADIVQSLRIMGLLKLALGRLTEAEALQREALEISSRKLGPDHQDTLKAARGLSDTLKWQAKYAEAEEIDRRVLAGRRRLLGDDHPDSLLAASSLGETLRNLKQFPEAETLLRDVVQRSRRVLGDDHPDTLISISRLGMLMYDMGRLDEAYPFYRESLDGRRRRLGKEHPNTLTSLSNMGFLLQKMGRLAESETHYREALEARIRVSGQDHPATLTTWFNLGRLQTAQNKLAEAEKTFRDVLERRRKVLGNGHADTQNTLLALGEVLLKRSSLQDAEATLRECRQLREGLPAGDPRIAEVAGPLGEAIAMQGRFAEAEPMLLQAHSGLGAAASKEATLVAVRRVADMYAAWKQADPQGGHEAKASEWAQKLSELAPAGRTDGK